ncbi:hypothetical protein, partial [Bombilactobacillus bombi]|uniref:hypothetical protein n=1 Tax=Bombilactobacillus bombi TaxID=1303590 RepID=UPI0015E5DD58
MKLIKLLLSTIIGSLSIIIYPIILTQKYPYHFDNNMQVALVMFFVITIYGFFFLPLHPNRYFKFLYTLIIALVLWKMELKTLPIYLISI